MVTGDRHPESTVSNRDRDVDARDEDADRREREIDIREGVLDRWERELTQRAIALDLIDNTTLVSLDVARRERQDARRQRRADAEARHEAAIQRGVDRMRGGDEQPASAPDVGTGRALERLAAIVAGSTTMAETLDAILDIATDAVSDAAAATLTLLVADQLEPASSTDAWAGDLDAAQLRLARGPLPDAGETRTLVVTEDLAADERWQLGDALGAAARRGVVSAPIVIGDTAAGALTMYAVTGERLDDRTVLSTLVLAAHASLAIGWSLDRLGHRAQAEAWERALASRDEIGQAKGILMEQLDLTSDAAFELLRTTSQRQNAKVRDLAQYVTTHRRLPDTEGS